MNLAPQLLTNISNLFIYSGGQAIWMDENMRYGKTDSCTTFNNPPLCKSGDFEIRVLEVYGFIGAWTESCTSVAGTVERRPLIGSIYT